MEGELELPFKVEYAKSARASCKGCRNGINKDELRLAVMVQSPKFDGKIPNWYHFACFFAKQKVKTTGDIQGFNSIRWEDQKKIKDKIGGGSSSGSSSASAAASQKSSFKDFSTEYAKSNRSTCRGCDEKINKGEVRISKLEFEGERSRMYGPQSMWHHVDCFVKKREELGFFGGGEDLPGFMSLGADDQKELKSKLKKMALKRKASETTDEPPAKKGSEESKEEKKLKEQSDLLFSYYDKLKVLSKRECQDLLEYNDQEVPVGESRILNLLADCMAFGALEKCKECGGQLKFRDDAYHCTGDVSAWSKCQYSSQNPDRQVFKVPDELKEEYPFLKAYKYKKRNRIYPKHPDGPSCSVLAHGVLNNLRIVIIGKLSTPKEDIGKLIETYKGKVTSKFEDKVICVISTKDEVKSMPKKMVQAKEKDIPVVSEKFLEEIPKMKSPMDVAEKIKELSICDWGSDQTEKIQRLSVKGEASAKSKAESMFTKNFPDKVKLTVKGGAAVDPDSGLQDTHQVYAERGCIYNAVLGSVDVQQGRNSYYKLQLLKSDKSDRYKLFRAWGRLGTTIGGNKTETFETKLDAVMEFKRLYEEKTGNRWEDRDNFVKHPNKFFPVEVDYGDEGSSSSLKKTGKSRLPQAVQDLICLIFDVETMKKTMLEFEIDLKKMPLGRLTKKQIEKAYSVLTEVQELLTNDGTPAKFLDASNRFYTLIPHDFGMRKPPLLDNEEIIKSKREMLDSLLEIEIAYNFLKGDCGSDVDPIDYHYEQLKAKIEVLDKDQDEFKMIDKYVKNTHAKTHKQYDLVIEEVFKVARSEENKRFKPFKKLHNRKLLWHGSRLTNYAGILSHGLKIAPPEAPVTGYMFGKGIYFADMVSKSANYCQTSKSNSTGLLLLCEVALGNMYERTRADFITKLPPDHHSTKGIGKTSPDPSKSIHTQDGVEIPLGEPIEENKKTALLYNEYIVYDVAQVNIKYLLKVNFKWKY